MDASTRGKYRARVELLLSRTNPGHRHATILYIPKHQRARELVLLRRSREGTVSQIETIHNKSGLKQDVVF
eukprot:3873340-Amphidinium_carterae.1